MSWYQKRKPENRDDRDRLLIKIKRLRNNIRNQTDAKRMINKLQNLAVKLGNLPDKDGCVSNKEMALKNIEFAEEYKQKLV